MPCSGAFGVGAVGTSGETLLLRMHVVVGMIFRDKFLKCTFANTGG